MTKNQDFESKYAHVVPGSTRAATPDEVMAGKTYARHGHVCQIRCVDCGANRYTSKQDAYQTKRCAKCQKTALNARRSKRKREEKTHVE